MCISKINKSITLETLTEKENLYFDRKSARTDEKKIANEVASFANANGGILAVGIEDDGKIDGFNKYGIDKLNNIQKIVSTYLKPSPIYQKEIVEIKNYKNEMDKILLFHIEPSMNFIVRNEKDEVYCRQGDSSIKLTHDQIRSLEYDKKERNFETEIVKDSSVDDIDHEVVKIYKERIEAQDMSDEEVLKARGYLKDVKGKLKFINAGMLLFGKIHHCILQAQD